ncbi:MAG: TetR/AcrR family transcriptional regulator [Proteobacteria bacterium]|nr:TetR/AcrR family transcriptional regulator [Pseudomonadota bacterium]MCP4920071.1 TetR/AcrR family transcriptional regulator [Pseudomonadota bacterium]
MARTKRLTAAQRRTQLIEVGRQVFAKAGYDATSVEEIARSAGVSKPIVYEHFGGKEGLFAVIVDREMEALVQRVAHKIAKGGPRVRFEGAVIAFLTYVEERPDGFAVLTRDAPPTTASYGMHSVISDLADRISDIFDKEFEPAEIPPSVSPIYAHALIGMVTAAGQWLLENPELPKEEVARHVAAIGWMGLRHLPDEPALATGSRQESGDNLKN